MRDEIYVQVEGPVLLRFGIRAVLDAYRGIRVVDHGPKVAVAGTWAGTPDALLLIAVDRSSDVLCDGLDDQTNTLKPIPSPSLPVPFARVALVTGDAETELVSACARGVNVLLSIYDEPESLHRGVLAAARGEAYCSPTLSSHLVRALQRNVGRRDPGTRIADRLSGREREVAELAAAGASNEEISQQLFIAVRTVKAHLTEVYRKLDIKRRGQIHQLVYSNGSTRRSPASDYIEP